MDLNPSKLGTQDYWQEFYKTEIRNFKENPNDTGECWFEDSSAPTQIVRYIAEEFEGQSVNVLDLGTGNGRLLFGLRDEDVEGDFLGIDYVESSVDLAREVAAAEGYDVEFQQVDFLKSSDWTDRKFDIVLDKGTLDAIALSVKTDTKSGPELYAERVLPLVKPGGILLITSCNFTEKELAKLIGRPYENIEYPKFLFGGQEGSTVVSLVFQC